MKDFQPPDTSKQTRFDL